MKQQEKKGSNPIQGCLAPFQGTLIEVLSNDICSIHKHNAIASLERYYNLRSTAKSDTAILLRRAAKRCGKYQLISNQSRFIIDKYLRQFANHPYCHSYVMCVVDMYNDKNILDNLNSSKCNTPRSKKAIQHASKDLEKATETYIVPVLEHMEQHIDTFPAEILNRYRDVRMSLNFVCHYFKELFCGELPEVITSDLFIEAQKIDSQIAHYYVLSQDGVRYERVRRRGSKTFNLVTQECATLIISHQWNN